MPHPVVKATKAVSDSTYAACVLLPSVWSAVGWAKGSSWRSCLYPYTALDFRLYVQGSLSLQAKQLSLSDNRIK